MTRNRVLIGLTALTMMLALLFDAPRAAAAIIYDNGGPNTGAGGPITGVVSDEGGVEAADDFVLATGQSTIRDIHWSGEYAGGAPPATDSFTANIYSDASGAPDALVTAVAFGPISRVDAGINSAIFNFAATVSAVSLTAGTTYWLSILNQNDTVSWLWTDNGATGNSRQRILPGEEWFIINDFGLTFSLTDDGAGGQVPEPGTLMLLISGAIGLGWLRGRAHGGQP